MLRRVRSRFGMSAPQVTVRAHIPWYCRLFVVIMLLIAAIVVVNITHIISGRYSGYDKNMAEQELTNLRNRVETLETEAERLRGISNGSESSLQIERTAQQKLGEQVKRLESENGRLREDLAAFDSLATDETKNEAISIRRMQVIFDSAAGGAYRYRFLLVAPLSRPDREFKGRLQLVATVQQDGKTVIVNIPEAATSDSQKFQVKFKYFRRIEDSFTLPVHAVLKKLEVRLMQGETVVTSQQVITM